MECWASEATILPEYTANDNKWVCPNCVDIVDYGLIPYTIPPETPIPRASSDQVVLTTLVPPLDFRYFDPLSGSPQEAQARYYTWDQQLYSNWETLTFLNWEEWGTTS